MPTNMQGLVAANVDRHYDGAARQVARARAALPKLKTAPPDPGNFRPVSTIAQYVTVVRMRCDYPNDTVDQLAQRAGMSKGMYWSRLRRALKMAEAMPENANDNQELVLF